MVAGAWLPGAAWDDVVPELRAADHGVHPLTLSGLGEKRRPSGKVGQRTHVRDIVDEVERLGLRKVVLVGHSYSGIPVGQAAEQIGERLARVVFVDSNIPADGESFVSAWPEGRPMVEEAIAANGGYWPPPAAEEFAPEGMVGDQGLSGEQLARLTADCVPHPGATLTEPAELRGSLGELPATYVKCLLDGPEPPPDVAELLATSERWRLVELDTGHWPMYSRPKDLARVLLEAAHT